MILEFKQNYFTALCLPGSSQNILCLSPSFYSSGKQILVAYLPRFETESLGPTVDIEFISLNLTEAQIIKTEVSCIYTLKYQ